MLHLIGKILYVLYANFNFCQNLSTILISKTQNENKVNSRSMENYHLFEFVAVLQAFISLVSSITHISTIV